VLVNGRSRALRRPSASTRSRTRSSPPSAFVPTRHRSAPAWAFSWVWGSAPCPSPSWPRSRRRGSRGWPGGCTAGRSPTARWRLTRSGHCARQSHALAVLDESISTTAGGFRGVTLLVLIRALARAGTRAYEPMHRFRLEVPAAQVHVPRRRLPALNGGEGVLEDGFHGYQAVRGAPPARPRSEPQSPRPERVPA